jgi:O-antigen/teichoic acid export membrane protein
VHKQETTPAILAIQTCLIALVIFLLGVVVVKINLFGLFENTNIALAGILHGLSQQLFLIATLESRSRGSLSRYSLQNLSRGLLVLIAGFCVAYTTGSALFSLLVEAILSILLSGKFLFHSLQLPRLRLHLIAHLALRRMSKIPWATASILMFNGIVSFLLLSGDRWVASALLDLPNFALYSFAWMVILLASSIQALINASAFPMIAKNYAQYSREKIFIDCFKLSLRVATISLIVSVILYFSLWFLIPKFFPAYTESRKLILIFLGISILRVSDFFSSFLIICNYGKNLLAINILSIGIAAIIYLGLIAHYGVKVLGATEIAYVTLATTLIFYLLLISQSWKKRHSIIA